MYKLMDRYLRMYPCMTTYDFMYKRCARLMKRTQQLEAKIRNDRMCR